MFLKILNQKFATQVMLSDSIFFEQQIKINFHFSNVSKPTVQWRIRMLRFVMLQSQSDAVSIRLTR